MEPDRLQRNSNATSLVAQQYSSVTVVSLRFAPTPSQYPSKNLARV